MRAELKAESIFLVVFVNRPRPESKMIDAADIETPDQQPYLVKKLIIDDVPDLTKLLRRPWRLREQTSESHLRTTGAETSQAAAAWRTDVINCSGSLT